ncbi:hypothetical protein IM700_016400 [Paenibacillus sp. DXFW5]|uniref:DUF707 domain-containing protein n=1 Tax=Paenibacillus rhizolycopersici TaxID=2780073 RepID=A0ABS2H739_9BACL|nr:DUF707 domain-containing protein [Paenibacillus rhizolycopersici]MBM6997242.1 hypothetical protein [Paenibacillus rhizolycopersici]
MSTKRRNLIVCRAGNASLHPKWIESETRNFDLLIDYYGDEEQKYADHSDLYITNNNGRKFSAIYNTILKNQDKFEQYDAVWFPDDDLLTDTENINKMFDIFHAHNLALAQPALTNDSFYSHHITLQNSETTLRYSFYCEVMAPIFSRDALFQCYHSFNLGQVGWGLDFIWPQILGYPHKKIAIIDETPVKHTRPVGGGEIYKNLLLHPRDEVKILMQLFTISNLVDYMSVYGGELRSPSTEMQLPLELSNSLLSSRLIKGSADKIIYDDLCVKQYLYPSVLKINNLAGATEPARLKTSDGLMTSLKAFTLLKQGTEPAQVVGLLQNIEDNTIINLLALYQGDPIELLNAIAIGFYQNEQHDRVMNYLTKAYEQNSMDNDTLYNLGYVLYQYGEKDLSLRFLEMIESSEEYVAQLINLVSNAG